MPNYNQILVMKKLIVLFAFLPLFAAAQNTPGYLGKRFILGYGLNITPSLGLASADEVPGEGSFKIITKNAFDLEYVIHKKYSLVVGLDAFNTYTAEEYNTTIDINGQNVRYESIENSKVSSLGFSFGLKSYQKHFAPLGSNWEYRVFYRTSSVSELQTTIDSLNIMGSNFTQYGFSLGYNLNRISNDQIVIGIGFNLNLNLTMDANSGELYLDAAYSLYPEDQQADLRGQAIRRVQVRDIFYFKFGIGYLL